ncbi:MAG TPA: alpha/beta hydrolase [Leptospiraceae bacterium]|nr:alpha/beta hydrolase [Leptospiraceae bacterium]HMW06557.1 alpha/beta hydrolase [Leptospiraceae bacterium]HMX32125.1 alpha/beta hydrolase [Leptospiraceae bacterium]HMY31253.1 alpha/beta hydrolase [Leptospiraceae bacterium]HMZ66836.1 alpha/beta hydrolase [Leptospiraceae bacterium]
MKRNIRNTLAIIIAFLLTLYISGIFLFSYMILHPHWHHPGLTHLCSQSQLEFSPELCIDHPEDAVKLKFESIQWQTDQFIIDGWLFPASTKSNRVVIFIHGAGADRRNGFKLVPFLLKSDYNVILYDAPNHGRTTNNGLGVSYGIRESIGFIAVLNWAKEKYKHVVVISTSAGTSTFILSKENWIGKVDAAVIENPFYSMERIIKENKISKFLPDFYLEIIFKYVSFKGEFDFKSIKPGELVRDFPEIPIVVFHGTADKTTPYQHGVDLYSNLSIRKKVFFEAKNTGHCRIWDDYPKEFEEKTLKAFEDGINIAKNKL